MVSTGVEDRSGRSVSEPPASSLNNSYLSPGQLKEKLEQRKKAHQALRLRTFNLAKQAARICKALSLHKKLLVRLSTDEISNVRQLLAQALQKGSSPSAIISKVQRALEGKFHSRSYSDTQVDLAILVLRIGGQSLLHAMHKGAGLPGITFVYDKMRSRTVSTRIRALHIGSGWVTGLLA